MITRDLRIVGGVRGEFPGQGTHFRGRAVWLAGRVVRCLPAEWVRGASPVLPCPDEGPPISGRLQLPESIRNGILQEYRLRSLVRTGRSPSSVAANSSGILMIQSIRCAVLLAALVGLLDGRSARAAEPLTTIAFGSCAKQDQPQPIWQAVRATQPQLFVFLGDNIYGDTQDMALLRRKWGQLAEQPGFQALRQSCRVTGTWDDHDYGQDDAGAEYPHKRESQQIFLDFLQVPQDDPRRTREGVYSAEVYGPPGQRVQVILLDARYHRSPQKKGFQPGEPGEGFRGKYLPNTDPGVTVLGETQWAWLAEQLRVPAELRVIGSGVQVVPDEHGSESWGNFPNERRRLFRTIRESGATGVVLLSGDRHLAEIARLPVEHPDSIGYPLYDITSSSLNAPSGNFTKAGVRFANEINSYRMGLTYFDVNFGTIQIDWTAADPIVRLQVRDLEGGVVLQQRVKLSDLRRRVAGQ